MSDKRNLKLLSDYKIKNIVLISLFSAVIAVCSLITIPFTIPFTMQLFGVFSALHLLGGKRGTISVLLYIFIGSVGLPVFSGFSGGLSRLFDATGGFITGFVFSGLIYWLTTSIFKGKRYTKLSGLFTALITCYISGTLWYALLYSRGDFIPSLKAALVTCVVPFIIPDLLKIALTILVCRKIEKYKLF